MTEAIKQSRTSSVRKLVVVSNVLMIAAALVMLAALRLHLFTARRELLFTGAFVLVAASALLTLINVSRRKH